MTHSVATRKTPLHPSALGLNDIRKNRKVYLVDLKYDIAVEFVVVEEPFTWTSPVVLGRTYTFLFMELRDRTGSTETHSLAQLGVTRDRNGDWHASRFLIDSRKAHLLPSGLVIVPLQRIEDDVALQVYYDWLSENALHMVAYNDRSFGFGYGHGGVFQWTFERPRPQWSTIFINTYTSLGSHASNVDPDVAYEQALDALLESVGDVDPSFSTLQDPERYEAAMSYVDDNRLFMPICVADEPPTFLTEADRPEIERIGYELGLTTVQDSVDAVLDQRFGISRNNSDSL